MDWIIYLFMPDCVTRETCRDFVWLCINNQSIIRHCYGKNDGYFGFEKACTLIGIHKKR